MDFRRSSFLHILVVLGGLCAADVVAGEPPAEGDGSRENVITRIGIAGCHRQDFPAPALSRYLEAQPQLMLWVGDNVYADTEDDIGHIEACYAALEAKPAFRLLRDKAITIAGWDDHDYGLDNSGRNYALKQESKRLFRSFWKQEGWIPEERDGVYHARLFGQGNQTLQVIILDPRFNREDEGEAADTLGESQWRWLEHQLREPADLRLVVSGYQVLLDREARFETWAKFPRARQRLFDLIRRTGAENVIFVTGDQHYGEVLRVRNALGYDAIELMFSGINQEEPHVLATHRVSPVAHAKDAYALIDIQWQKDGPDAANADFPHLVFRCFDARDNSVELSYRVNFSELKSPPRGE